MSNFFMSIVTLVIDVNIFKCISETIKSNGNAQKYRGSKAVNKSWLEYKINKSNQGGKQN